MVCLQHYYIKQRKLMYFTGIFFYIQTLTILKSLKTDSKLSRTALSHTQKNMNIFANFLKFANIFYLWKVLAFLQIWKPDLTQVFYIAVNNYKFVEIFVKTKRRPFKMYRNFKTHLPFFNGSNRNIYRFTKTRGNRYCIVRLFLWYCDVMTLERTVPLILWCNDSGEDCSFNIVM